MQIGNAFMANHSYPHGDVVDPLRRQMQTINQQIVTVAVRKPVAEMDTTALVYELREYGLTGRGLVRMSIKALRLSVQRCRDKRAA